MDDAQDDLDFCIETLGLRLVKKTVNFDNHNVFHFYYGDECGSPGTIWTTFPYKSWGVPVGEKGAGQIVATTFSVPAASLAFWKARFERDGIEAAEGRRRFDDECLAFRDPSGLVFELVASDADTREPWQSTIDDQSAIRGLHSVTMVVTDPRKTVDLMTDVLGYTVVADAEGRIRLAVNGNAPGHVIDVVHDAKATPARNGIGTVHHVAMAIGGDEEQLRLREDLIARGCKVTDVRDRQYFKSIYFREPGGVLFEIATDGPGFATDEPLEHLGEKLALPPFLEPHRAQIEAGLRPISPAPAARQP